MLKELTQDDLSEWLGRTGKWRRDERDGVESIAREYAFASFEDAMHFMATAARYISRTDHHPGWTNEYKSVRVTLTTWDAGKRVSSRDTRLAEYLDQLYREYV